MPMSRITVLIITSLSQTEFVDQALQVGFSLHVVKVGAAIRRRGVGLKNVCSACSSTLVMSALKDFKDDKIKKERWTQKQSFTFFGVYIIHGSKKQ